MNYISLFSGIDAASVAWSPLGWKAIAFCEIDAFCSAALRHHYPDVPNLGDVEKANFDAIGHANAIIFGSPCQSFSVAGKRLGMDDPRGNLALVAGRVVYEKRPEWFVFENVPGLLSSDAGWDFGTLLAAFAGYAPGSVFKPPADGWANAGVIEQAPGGYGLAWRVLDAQFVRVDGFTRAVPQRRRRVFVVGYIGDWRRAAAVLLEFDSMRGDSPPRREKRAGVARTVSASTGGASAKEQQYNFVGKDGTPLNALDELPDVAWALQERDAKGPDSDTKDGHLIVQAVADPISANEQKTYTHEGTGNFRLRNVVPILEAGARTGRIGHEGTDGLGIGDDGDPMYSLQASKQHAIAFSCKDYGNDATEDLAPTMRGMNETNGNANAGGQLAVAFKPSHYTRDKDGAPSEVYPPLTKETDKGDQEAVIFQTRIARNGRGQPDTVAPSFNGADAGATSDMRPVVATRSAVRRLTPIECERLQGFEDGYTAIPTSRRNAALEMADMREYFRRTFQDVSDEELAFMAADGPRYKALGNSMAVNVIRWIGMRIAMVDRIRFEPRD